MAFCYLEQMQFYRKIVIVLTPLLSHKPLYPLPPKMTLKNNFLGFYSSSLRRILIVSVQFSRSVRSDSLRPHELQHARPPCPSPTPGVYSNSCPSSRWCHPAISSSVVPFSSCPQSLPASGSFSMSQLFTWGVSCLGICNFSSAADFQLKTEDWFLWKPKEFRRALSLKQWWQVTRVGCGENWRRESQCSEKVWESGEWVE